MTSTDDEFRRAVQDETGITPTWAIRHSVAGITASSSVPRTESVRGLVSDVATEVHKEIAA